MLRTYQIYGKSPALYGDKEIMGGTFEGKPEGKRWERFKSALSVKGFTVTQVVPMPELRVQPIPKER